MKKRFAVVFGLPILALFFITMIMVSLAGPVGFFLGPMVTALAGLLFSLLNMACADLFFYCLHGRKKTHRDSGFTCLDVWMNFKENSK